MSNLFVFCVRKGIQENLSLKTIRIFFCTPGNYFDNTLFSAFACLLFNVDGYQFDGSICKRDDAEDDWLPYINTHEMMICSPESLKKTNTIEPTFTKKYLGIDLGF